MNVKRYLSIVGVATLVFVIFAIGILAYDYLYTPFGSSLTNTDGSYVEYVEGIDEVEKSKPYNILVLGVDVEAHLTDVMMLCQIDTVNHKMNMLSIPRDTRVNIDGKLTKINSAYHGGIEQTIKSVKELTNLPVHYYFLVNTTAFRDAIDTLDGVDFDVPQDMNYEDPLQNLYIHLEKGYQHLDGDHAEQLVRFRRYANGDIDRIAVQQSFFAALVDQKLSAKYVLKIPELYSIIAENSSTNMRVADLLSAGKQLLAIDKADYSTYTVPGEGKMIDGVSYFVPYTDDLKTLALEVFGGENQ
jgi:LCP family protein required for cell wall assembly